MFIARRAALVVLPALVIFGLAGCSLLQAQGTGIVLTGAAACAQGHTWTVDTKDIAAQVLADLTKRKIAATKVDDKGTQTMEWLVTGEMMVTTDYTLTVTAAPAADQALIATQVHKGTATGKAYVNADVAIPRNWDASAFTVDTKFTLNDKDVPDPAPFTIPATDFDDGVGIELTCNGTNMTTHARGSVITQKWTRSD
jgi:hypothetical protein